MNSSTPPAKGRIFTAEAFVGLGITIGSFGFLFLLLGWAQYMRQVHDAAMLLGGLGAAMVVIGLVVALLGKAGKRSS